jgi:GxxExxY protein
MTSDGKDHKGDPRTYSIIGAAIEVHKQLGCGFSEAIYSEALAIELQTKGIPYESEVEVPVLYKGQELKRSYRADFICFDSVIVEIKALSGLGGREEAQLMSYLKASGLKVGLLVNFGAHVVECKRRVF